MTVPSGKHRSVGFRRVYLFGLDQNGYLAASGTSAYEGLKLTGAKTLEINLPEPRAIYHSGDDRILATDFLPPLEGATGILTVSGQDYSVDALISGQNEVTLGETKFFGESTDKAGEEAEVSVLAYAQSLDAETGIRRWDFMLFPLCRMVRGARSFNENPAEKQFTLYPQVVSKYPWGIAFSISTEGFTEAQYLSGVGEYKPAMVAFKADGTATVFNLPTDRQAVNTNKMKVFEFDGSTATDVTGTVTLAVGSVTFGVAPASGNIITVWYEHA